MLLADKLQTNPDKIFSVAKSIWTLVHHTHMSASFQTVLAKLEAHSYTCLCIRSLKLCWYDDAPVHIVSSMNVCQVWNG